MPEGGDVVDVLVIGAGAAGAAFTWSLAEAGINVMCLDQGGWVDPNAYPPVQDDWELHRQTDLNPDPNVRALPEDYPVNNTESPIAPLMYNAVGGSTIHWTAQFPRFHPSDFRVKTLDGVADDWPITYHDLEPFYDLNDRMMGVSGVAGDPAYPPKNTRPMPPLPLGKVGIIMAAGFEKLGWHWWPIESAVLTQPYEGRSACNNCGPCDIGCTRGAKASTDITYWPKALAHGAVLNHRTRVREVTIGRDGLVDGVTYYDAEGGEHHQEARIVVLACNGVGTPRLLLNTTSSQFPDGLANSSGLVGNNLMFHPCAKATGVFDEPLEGYKGPVANCILSHQFYETDPLRGFVRGHSLDVERSHGPLQTAMGGIGGHKVPWGEDHRRNLSEWFGHTITVGALGEDLPEAHNQVVLDPDLTDGYGIPAPKVIYKMSENSLRMMEHSVARGTEALLAAGARKVMANPLLRPSGWHLMGTARMGTNPSESVVNPWGKVPRREEPLHHRWEHLRDRGRGEPHLHYPGPGAVHRRTRQEQRPPPPELRSATHSGFTRKRSRHEEREDAMTAEGARGQPAFSDAQRALVKSVADRIIPPDQGFPGAGELGVADYIDGIAAGSEDIKRLFAHGLSRIEGGAQGRSATGFAALPDEQKDDVLRELEAGEPGFFEELVRHTYNGYYTNPTIIARLGLEVRPPQPLGYDLEPGDLTLLENVKKRGRMYREV